VGFKRSWGGRGVPAIARDHQNRPVTLPQPRHLGLTGYRRERRDLVPALRKESRTRGAVSLIRVNPFRLLRPFNHHVRNIQE
jgi:hypothetical protein